MRLKFFVEEVYRKIDPLTGRPIEVGMPNAGSVIRLGIIDDDRDDTNSLRFSGTPRGEIELDTLNPRDAEEFHAGQIVLVDFLPINKFQH